MSKIAVIYYSATGNVHALAQAVAEGAAGQGAEVRIRRVANWRQERSVDSNPVWRANVDATTDAQLATTEDVRWADGLAFGTPTRFGNVSAQLKQFIDIMGPLWAAGELANKVATGFMSSTTLHGRHESTLLALYNTLYHWGGIVVTPGYTDPAAQAVGNPYGTSHASAGGPPGPDVLEAANHQGRRLAAITQMIAGGQTDQRHAA